VQGNAGVLQGSDMFPRYIRSLTGGELVQFLGQLLLQLESCSGVAPGFPIAARPAATRQHSCRPRTSRLSTARLGWAVALLATKQDSSRDCQKDCERRQQLHAIPDVVEGLRPPHRREDRPPPYATANM